MSDLDKRLASIREQIDALDKDLLALLNRRAGLAQAVAQVKDGKGENNDYYRPDREAEVLRRSVGANGGPLPDEEVARLFREVMSACRALEKPMTIAFLGPEGTFTEAAALRHFGHSIKTVPLGSIDAVFREVESRASDYGVVPIENSTEGVVNHTLDTFFNSPLFICGEVQLRIHHHLLSKAPARDAVKRVYSHQQSIAQCRKWLDANLPGADRINVSSNAEGARLASQEAEAAAVASEVAGETYELTALAANIEDEPNNTTRFLVIGEQVVGSTGMDKTSLLLSAKNQPGALFGLLSPFAERGIDMTRIESRPSRNALWEYVFFVDILGHRDDENVRQALREIESHAAVIKVLGSFPRADG